MPLPACLHRSLPGAKRTAALLRIAVLLHRSHEAESIPQLDVRVAGNTMSLSLPKTWLDARPLLRTDLEHEPEGIAGLGIELTLDR